MKLPYTPNENESPLPEGTHNVTINSIKLITTKSTGEPKLVVSYGNASGTFDDYLGFKSPKQSARTFALVCRLHELAGLGAPEGSDFDEAPLLGHAVQITIVPNEKGYLQLADFPSASLGPDEIAF